MSGPPTGIYQIIRHGIAAPPVRPLGANIGRPVEPVIVGGESTVVSSPLFFSTNYPCSMHSVRPFLHGAKRYFVVVRPEA